jgi:hypothetical protein
MTMKGRRAWWELQKGAAAHMVEIRKKWDLLKLDNFDFAMDILKLPRGFTCYHYRKDVSIEERIKGALATSQANGHLEYCLLEIEHTLFHRIPSDRQKEVKTSDSNT